LKLFHGVKRVIELFDVARANQGRGDALVTKHPGDGHLRQTLPARTGHFIELTHVIEVLFAQLSLLEGTVLLCA
jgi:hypothetical protein